MVASMNQKAVAIVSGQQEGEADWSQESTLSAIAIAGDLIYGDATF